MLLLWPKPDKRIVQGVVARATLIGTLEAYDAGALTGAVDVGRMSRALGEHIRASPPADVPLAELEARAELAASSYAEAWLASFRAREDIVKKYGERTAVRQTTEEHAFRINRIAATETPAAFNEARLETVRASIRDLDIDVIRIWRCDAGPCEICTSYDGEVADLHGGYASGEEPGSVHPHCRCSEDIQVRH